MNFSLTSINQPRSSPSHHISNKSMVNGEKDIQQLATRGIFTNLGDHIFERLVSDSLSAESSILQTSLFNIKNGISMIDITAAKLEDTREAIFRQYDIANLAYSATVDDKGRMVLDMIFKEKRVESSSIVKLHIKV